MNEDSRALFKALLMLFELLMAVFMEKHTPKSNANSSLPSSQSPNEETALARPGTKGKGPQHHDVRTANTRTVEHVEHRTVAHCARCGEDLRPIASHHHERRTRIDIVFEKTVTHVDAETKRCPRCHTDTRAPFPAEMAGGTLHYGPGLKAYVVHLLVAQMLSLKRVAQSVARPHRSDPLRSDLPPVPLPTPSGTGRVGAPRHRAPPHLPGHARRRNLAARQRKNHWIHVYSAGHITLKRLHPKRGREAIEAIGIIPATAAWSSTTAGPRT